jgi:hypothetical protein
MEISPWMMNQPGSGWLGGVLTETYDTAVTEP